MRRPQFNEIVQIITHHRYNAFDGNQHTFEDYPINPKASRNQGILDKNKSHLCVIRFSLWIKIIRSLNIGNLFLNEATNKSLMEISQQMCTCQHSLKKVPTLLLLLLPWKKRQRYADRAQNKCFCSSPLMKHLDGIQSGHSNKKHLIKFSAED